MKNLKTTIAGIAVLALGAVFFYIDKNEVGLLCIPVGLGLIGAKDGNVTGGTKAITDEAKGRLRK